MLTRKPGKLRLHFSVIFVFFYGFSNIQPKDTKGEKSIYEEVLGNFMNFTELPLPLKTRPLSTKSFTSVPSAA
jgi:hypothetical protein